AEAVETVIKPRNTRNFEITNELDAFPGDDQKFLRNIEAIELLKTLAAEDREATEEEKKTLVRYVGWGGMPKAFDMTSSCDKPEWRSQLAAVLTEGEWESVRATVNNAHYTHPTVIRFIWDAVRKMGFNGGKIIEPAGGIGHFIGCMPSDIAAVSKIYASEVDPVSAGIMEALYPDAAVYAKGFEKLTFAPDSFDLAISNVPFGRYRVSDRKFDRLKLSIHDYFFAKALDLVRPGGIVAFITSHFTMDKHRAAFREYMAARADLVGAVRLPNGAFSAIANTDVMTDILFLQKRVGLRSSEAIDSLGWLQIDQMPENVLQSSWARIWANAYWGSHPDQVIGKFFERSGQHGNELHCKFDGDLAAALRGVLGKMRCDVYRAAPLSHEDVTGEWEVGAIPAPGDVKPGGYGIVDGVLMQNEFGFMESVESSMPAKTVERIKGMLAVRDAVRVLLRGDIADLDTASERHLLNRLYDGFVRKYGPLWSSANRGAMKGDPDHPLLLSLEYWDDEEEVATKSEIFTQKTVSRGEMADSAENLSEGIALSLNRFGKLNLAEMARWLNKSVADLSADFEEGNFAYLDPAQNVWVMADEYLSGNVREKLSLAESEVRASPMLKRNIEALKAVHPRDLEAHEIELRLGVPWVPPEDVQLFARELLGEDNIRISFSPAIAQWSVLANDYSVARNVVCTQTYGTPRMNAIELLSDALNQRTPTVRDTIEVDGRDKSVVNHPETIAARDKWHTIREEFRAWIWKEDARKERLVRLYNVTYNSTVERKYDGSHLTLPGLNPAIELRLSQKNAIWRSLVAKSNTLLAHAVGAGKTMIYIAAGMEAKRLGLCKKPLMTVPNHMLEQFAAEFLRLYPQANILAANKEDLSGNKRRTLLARIATGDWDGVIVTHSSYEKLPLSDGTIQTFIDDELLKLEEAIREAEADEDGSNTRLVKRIESTKKSVEAKLLGMMGRHRKDDCLCFEELGIDWLSVDEAHLFKNLHFATKMDRVAGLPQVSSMRAFDMFLKVRLIGQRRSDNRGVIFGTATPIANAIAEMYTMQRYLQLNRLQELSLDQFDNWAANFGETVTSIELAPDGSGYRMHSRFCRYVNIPELMSIFREVADIQTKEMLNLPEPLLEGGKHQVVMAPASADLKEFIQTLVARAEAIRSSDPEERPDPREDNMLMVTNDGRKAALDMRLIDPSFRDSPESKVNEAIRKVYEIWDSSRGDRLTQLVFCDLSTPTDKAFSIYNDVRKKLIAMGVPAGEIAFIHEYDSDVAKARLFRKVRNGIIRILLGTTQKMGMGTNVQDLLYAEHHLDAPWRPADVEQRDGRILRQGNKNKTVRIYRYVTEQSFDAYSWQTLETKMKFIAQVMTGSGDVRSVEEIELAALSYAEVKAIASGNPMVLEKAGVDAEVARFSVLENVHRKRQNEMRWELKRIEGDIEHRRSILFKAELDVKAMRESAMEFSTMEGRVLADREEAGKAIVLGIERARHLAIARRQIEVGKFGPFLIHAIKGFRDNVMIEIDGHGRYDCNGIETVAGAITVLKNAVERIPALIEATRGRISQMEQQKGDIGLEMEKPFEHAGKLEELLLRQREVDIALGLYQDDSAVLEAA
ncbi:MAG: hypothetical protein WAO76_18330, partial [Georgfuchsia sp.]